MRVSRVEKSASLMGRKGVSRTALLSQLRRFKREDDGVMVVFTVFLMLIILLVGGIGIDMMRFEMDRTRLQYTLDRAILAAADLDQTLDPTSVVEDYFDKAGLSDFLASVDVDQGLNFRTVSATATKEMPTQFMHMMGVDIMDVPAGGTAEERVGKVEISMVLDISGSMRNNNKMTNLKNAAKTFVTTVIKDQSEDRISLSLVPYSEHVNAGKDIYDRLLKNHRHPYSHCLEIPDSEFNNADFNTSIVYDQMQHFQWNYDGYNNDRTDTVCPRYSYETITPLSQNETALKNQINKFQPRAGTSIFLGMKWAVGLLDPSLRPLTSQLIGIGKIDPEFASRPANYDDPDTLKTVILMTDGKNDRSYRIRSRYYRSRGQYQDWNSNNFWYYLRRNVSSYYWSNWYRKKYDATLGDILTNQICTAAKQKGIVIWAIGFEVDDHGANVMKNCASSTSHFFRVEGIEIRDAFEAIARQINQLRLTQ